MLLGRFTAILLSGCSLCAAAAAQTAPPPFYNRMIRSVEPFAAGGTAGVRILYGLQAYDPSPRPLDLSADVEVSVNGQVLDLIPVPVKKESAIVCAVTCAGACPSIFGDGVCTGCGCKYSNWFTSTFGDGDAQPGDVVAVRLIPASAAAPELDARDDGLRIVVPETRGETFRRGDSNGDGKVEMSDAIASLGWLFLGAARPVCLDAADVNDDGKTDLGDPVGLLGWLFVGGAAPRRPGPFECGADPTEDSLGICGQGACQGLKR